ncbi:phosphodiester glycosidase family protein [Nocardioides sp. Soil805]|uniref:phosphodiester glycosidase family protein n=1 Tax=Nocardioides sp. Soil805 TaxID=1736416 RepID=UPI00070265A8|nr:phosphodiester glycosidase family protein [Nocardioides sp. Soil805]KRF36915.1 hypothetical protein ASG94_05855 [Nocardioides sp. Soil805]
MPASNRLTAAFSAGALASALVAGALVAGATSSSADTGGTSSRAGDASRGDRAGLTPAQRRALREPGTVLGTPGQTSDGVRGEIAKPWPAGRRAKARVTSDVTYDIAPGVQIREWDQVDARGPIRANLITVDLNAPNISLDHIGSKYAVRRKTVSQFGAMEGALGAVNGDFFDISDTGAALGPAVDRERGLLHGPATGWIPENATFYLDATGYHVGPMVTRTKLRQRPRWPVSGINAATVADNTIGLYTSDWGWTKGYSVTDGAKDVREVVVVDGRIRSNKSVLSKGHKVKGQVLVGRGSAAKLLKQLEVGRKLTFKYKVKPSATMAVSGDRSILLDGVRTVVNDRLLHPRTAIGIDADGAKLLILVIDGRSAYSRGYTMVELANMMLSLGAENALNFDGGGSSTMYSRTITGAMGLINEPSDGHERKVANALGIFYNGVLPPVTTPVPPAPTPTPAPTTPPPTTP